MGLLIVDPSLPNTKHKYTYRQFLYATAIDKSVVWTFFKDNLKQDKL